MSFDNLQAWTAKFLKYLQVERRISQNTLNAYAGDLHDFCAFLVSNRDEDPPALASFSRPAVRSYLAALHRRSCAARTIARKLSALRSFARYLLREGVVTRNPTLNIASPKLDAKLPHFLTRLETRTLLQMPDLNTPEGIRDLAILELFYGAGLRVSELVSLKVRQINFDRSTLRVLGKRNKSRVVPLGGTVVSDLQYYLQMRRRTEGGGPEHDDFLFVKVDRGPFTRQQMAAVVRSYMKRIVSADKAHPHALRHTFATHLLDEGADLLSVKELLGHSKLSTTQIYTHVTAEHLKRVYKKTHPRG